MKRLRRYKVTTGNGQEITYVYATSQEEANAEAHRVCPLLGARLRINHDPEVSAFAITRVARMPGAEEHSIEPGLFEIDDIISDARDACLGDWTNELDVVCVALIRIGKRYGMPREAISEQVKSSIAYITGLMPYTKKPVGLTETEE